MTTTVVESLPVLVYKLKSDPNILINPFNSTILKGGCSGGSGIDAYNTCPNKSTPQPKQTFIQPTACGSRLLQPPSNKFCGIILKIREPIADYLEKHGLPKNATCSFVSLVTSLVQRSYNAGLTILMMLYNLFPLLDGFVYLIRFILDKVLEICNARDRTEKILKGALFLGELIILCILVFAIFGIILMPVWALLKYILTKCLGIMAKVN